QCMMARARIGTIQAAPVKIPIRHARMLLGRSWLGVKERFVSVNTSLRCRNRSPTSFTRGILRGNAPGDGDYFGTGLADPGGSLSFPLVAAALLVVLAGPSGGRPAAGLLHVKAAGGTGFGGLPART